MPFLCHNIILLGNQCFLALTLTPSIPLLLLLYYSKIITQHAYVSLSVISIKSPDLDFWASKRFVRITNLSK